MNGMVYAVYWRTAGEGMHEPGDVRWVGAWSSLDDAKDAQRAVGGSWIDTVIVSLSLDGPIPESRQ